MRVRLPLSELERRELAIFVIGFAATIVGWAALHDMYLIGVEPRHFTEYHRPLLPISDHRLLACQYAVVATTGPGMIFGALAFAVGRLGGGCVHSLGFAWRLFLPFIAMIEASALVIGELAKMSHAHGQPLPYPGWLYPDETAGIAYSQSVNITAYLAAVGFGGFYLLILWRLRKRRGSF